MDTLTAHKRDVFGKRTQNLRGEGFIPGELYGHGIQNVHVAVPADAFHKVFREAGEHLIVTMDINGDKHPVLIHDVQVDPITDEVLSVDFYEVKMDEKVTAHVPLEFVGESPAVESLGGVLVKVMDEIEVEALPADLPHGIEVDISALTEFDKSIHVGDLPRTEKFEFTADPDAVVVNVSAPREEEEVEEEITPEDVIVEGEKKRAGETEEGDGNEKSEPGSAEE